jgi:hypothetical protein
MNNHLTPWQAPESNTLPTAAVSPQEFIRYATSLKENEQTKVIDALNQGFHELAMEFVWKRALTRLKQTLSTLGMQFVGEMLDRNDINYMSQPDSVLTDWDAIRLAENLGVINSTGALKLRYGFELLSHLSRTQEEELEIAEAIALIRNCVKYVLAEQNFGIANDFSRFRDRLVTESLTREDEQLQNLFGSPQFFLKTALRVLLATIKTEGGARLEHALTNLNLVLPEIWLKLTEADKWAVGNTYAESANEGKSETVKALRRALLKVSGFDYVPESLRSNTYKQAAQAVLSAHFSVNNFYNEYEVTNQLAQLGTVIPKPALIECMQAYLCVFLGNRYGASFEAAPLAEKELKRISSDRWVYYLDKVLTTDDVLLPKLTEYKPARRFCLLINSIDTNLDAVRAPDSKKLVDLAKGNDINNIKYFASFQERRLRGDTES